MIGLVAVAVLAADAQVQSAVPRAVGAIEVARAAVEGRSRGLDLEPRVHDTGVGAIVVAFSPRVSSVPVLAERLTVVLNRQLGVVAIFGELTSGPLEGAFNTGAPPEPTAAGAGGDDGGTPAPAAGDGG